MTEFIKYTAYVLVPVPATLYLGWAFYLRERRFRLAPLQNRFATVNAMLTAISLGLLLGTLPGLLYAMQFICYLSSCDGPKANDALLWTLLIVGTICLGALGGWLSYRYRGFFKRRRIPHYITVAAVCSALSSLSWLLADYIDFSLSHLN